MTPQKQKILLIVMIVLIAIMVVLGVKYFTPTKYDDITDYLTDPRVQSENEAQLAELEDSGISGKIYAENNILVYDYTFEVQLEISEETQKEALIAELDAGLNTLTDSFNALTAELRKVIDIDDITVRVIYRNADGTELYSRDFQ